MISTCAGPASRFVAVAYTLVRERPQVFPRSYKTRHGVSYVSKAFENRSMAEAEMLDTALGKAWDQLCDQSSWRYWFSGVVEHLKSADAFHIMRFEEERDSIRLRKTKDGLSMYIPIKDLRTMQSNSDRVDYMREVYIRFFERYAEVRGINPPPPWTGS